MNIISRAELLNRHGLPPDPEDPFLKMLAPEAREMHLASMDPPKTYYEIDPDARLYLLVGDGRFREVFAEEFRQAWGVVGGDRLAMIGFWRSRGAGVPTIELEPGLSLVGRYDGKSFLFGFNWEAMEIAYREGMIRNVIGHELGHGFCHIDPKSYMSYEGELTNAIVKGREDEANAKAQAWGFDMKALEHWGNKNRKRFAEITKNGNYLNPFTLVV